MDSPGAGRRHLSAIVTREQLVSVLGYMLDESEFLSPYGIRSISKVHEQNPYEVARDRSKRLIRLFLLDENGERTIYGHSDTFQRDPNWRDWILYHEYFHGETGVGLGASHWTG